MDAKAFATEFAANLLTVFGDPLETRRRPVSKAELELHPVLADVVDGLSATPSRMGASLADGFLEVARHQLIV